MFYGERAIWWLRIRATGATGHASRLPDSTAMQSLIASINQFLAFRTTQVDKLHGRHSHAHGSDGAAGGCSHAQAAKLGDVVSLNLTMLKGTCVACTMESGCYFVSNEYCLCWWILTCVGRRRDCGRRQVILAECDSDRVRGRL